MLHNPMWKFAIELPQMPHRTTFKYQNGTEGVLICRTCRKDPIFAPELHISVPINQCSRAKAPSLVVHAGLSMHELSKLSGLVVRVEGASVTTLSGLGRPADPKLPEHSNAEKAVGHTAYTTFTYLPHAASSGAQDSWAHGCSDPTGSPLCSESAMVPTIETHL